MLMEEEERERGKAIAKFTHLTVTERPRFIAHFPKEKKIRNRKMKRGEAIE
jgi:hypothetical protein